MEKNDIFSPGGLGVRCIVWSLFQVAFLLAFIHKDASMLEDLFVIASAYIVFYFFLQEIGLVFYSAYVKNPWRPWAVAILVLMCCLVSLKKVSLFFLGQGMLVLSLGMIFSEFYFSRPQQKFYTVNIQEAKGIQRGRFYFFCAYKFWLTLTLMEEIF